MKYKTFSIRLPLDLAQTIDNVAFQQFRKQNARNQMITQILLDWHATVAPSVKDAARKQRKPTVNAPSGD